MYDIRTGRVYFLPLWKIDAARGMLFIGPVIEWLERSLSVIVDPNFEGKMVIKYGK